MFSVFLLFFLVYQDWSNLWREQKTVSSNVKATRIECFVLYVEEILMAQVIVCRKMR